MSKFYKGQIVYCGGQAGRVIRMFGNKAVQVLTQRKKLVMAGTFPDRPIGEAMVTVKECWSVGTVSETGGVQ